MSLFSGKRRDEDDTSPAREAGAGATELGGTRSSEPGVGAGPDRRQTRGEGSPRSGGEAVANIGKSIIFKGDLTGDEDIEIEGQIEGKISLPKNQLTIGAHGRVKAELNAKAIVVVGHITGNVTATERVEVQASGVVEGDIRAPRLLIQEGAVVNGAVEMTKGEGVAARKPESPAPMAAAAGGGGGPAPTGEARRTG